MPSLKDLALGCFSAVDNRLSIVYNRKAGAEDTDFGQTLTLASMGIGIHLALVAESENCMKSQPYKHRTDFDLKLFKVGIVLKKRHNQPN